MKHLAFACLLAAASATFPATIKADYDIKLTGCVVRGESGGYLLTNTSSDPSWEKSSDATRAPGAVGTTGGFSDVFYWIRNENDLKPHVGHRVEVEGEIKGDLKEGEIKADRKDHWTEIEIKSAGESLKARVPHSSVVAPHDGDRKMSILVRKVDVKHVRMLAAHCH